jgi:hypothetical protein
VYIQYVPCGSVLVLFPYGYSILKSQKFFAWSFNHTKQHKLLPSPWRWKTDGLSLPSQLGGSWPAFGKLPSLLSSTFLAAHTLPTQECLAARDVWPVWHVMEDIPGDGDDELCYTSSSSSRGGSTVYG